MNLHREISAPELFILQSKVDALLAGWDERYKQFQLKNLLQTGKGAAEDMTVDAARRQDQLRHILARTLSVNDAIDWQALKDHTPYPMPSSFAEPRPTSTPSQQPIYQEPTIGFIDFLLGRKRHLSQQAIDRHSRAVAEWETADEARKTVHAARIAAWERQEAKFWAEHHRAKNEFKAEQASSHRRVDALRAAVCSGDPDAVIEHASLVLESSDYDGLFEKSYDIQYQPDQKLLLLEYDLPAPATLPQIKAVKYVKSTGELVETKISERERKSNFDSACYQICLRTIHELFEADVDSNFDTILFNGIVDSIHPGTGLNQRSCILSVLVRKEAFCEIDLARVDPKACFKNLKGVSAASLSALAPIAPVMEMNREDKRFVDAREVGADIGQATNLASMSWEDFEHLVRELFEKIFLARGGEVKVTQSSRDGGVDAIAFDPDPITGGKIVIQAKRYTRTVGIAAVRDLFGTVQNEGASKGILVTTADYGPDAYSFTSNKPLQLINGANLLHLLEQHGYKAHIDIAGARASRVTG